MLLFVVVMAGACTAEAPSKVLTLGPTGHGVCDRSWNPYGELPASCDRGCARPPRMPMGDPRTCDGYEPCLDQPACTLAANRDDTPRVDCAATFLTQDGHLGCCVETDIGRGRLVESFYECP